MAEAASSTTEDSKNASKDGKLPTITSSQVKPRTDFQQFALNLKRTAFGVRFAKLLLTDPLRFSPSDIVSAMRALGLNVPKEAIIAADLAQLMVTGAAAYNAYQFQSHLVDGFSTFNDIKSVTVPTAASIKLGTKLAVELGWIDRENQYVQIVEFGANVAMIYASGGLDVTAWLSLGMNFAFGEEKMKIKAKQLAAGAAADWYKGLVAPQAQAAAVLFKKFQESQKLPRWDENRLTAYGFIGAMAEAAPDLWPQFFPQFGWAPVYEREVVGTSEVTSWYGSKQRDSVRIAWQSVAGLNRDQIREWVFYGLIEPFVYPFYLANREYSALGKAPLFDLALISCMTNMERIGTSTDVSLQLNKLFLTPSDFADMSMHEYLQSVRDPEANIAISAGVTIQGKAQVSKAEQDAINKKRAFFLSKEALVNAEFDGRIDLIRRFPQVNEFLREHYTYPTIKNRIDAESWFKEGTKTRSGEVVYREAKAANWRMIRNYVASLAMMDDLRKDPFFKDWGLENGIYGTGRFEQYNFFQDVDRFQEAFGRLNLFSSLRQVNTLAMENVAYFLGTTKDKLIRLTPRDQEGPSKFTVQ